MASMENDPLKIGRKVFLWTVAGAAAFALSAWVLVS
jgi:hypothetical protein